MCCSNQRLVLIKTAAAQCWQDRADLVRFAIKSKEADAGRDRDQLGATTIEPAAVVRNLVVYMVNELTMRVHIGKVAAICVFHLRHLRQLRFVPTSSSMQRLVSALRISWIDCCNSTLYGLPAITLASLATNCLPDQIQTMSHDVHGSKQQKHGIDYWYICSDIVSKSSRADSFAWIRGVSKYPSKGIFPSPALRSGTSLWTMHNV